MQVALWQGQQFARNAPGCASRFREPFFAGNGGQALLCTIAANAARQVDFAHNTFANQIRRAGSDHFTDKLVPGCALKIVVAALRLQGPVLQIPALEQPDQCRSFRAARTRLLPNAHHSFFETNGEHIVDTLIMLAELACFEQKCHATFPLTRRDLQLPAVRRRCLRYQLQGNAGGCSDAQNRPGANAGCRISRLIRVVSGALPRTASV